MLSDDAKSSMGDSSKKMVMEGYQNYNKKKKKKVSAGTSVIPTLWSLMLK